MHDPSSGWPSGLDRRDWLRQAAAGTLALLLAPLAACSRGPGEPQPVRVPLATLPVGGRRVVLHLGLPVELRRTQEGVQGRSLLCTHVGCTVQWVESERIYQCPCHDGRYDAEGRVIQGPPPAPLASVPVRVEGETILVGG